MDGKERNGDGSIDHAQSRSARLRCAALVAADEVTCVTEQGSCSFILEKRGGRDSSVLLQGQRRNEVNNNRVLNSADASLPIG